MPCKGGRQDAAGWVGRESGGGWGDKGDGREQGRGLDGGKSAGQEQGEVADADEAEEEAPQGQAAAQGPPVVSQSSAPEPSAAGVQPSSSTNQAARGATTGAKWPVLAAGGPAGSEERVAGGPAVGRGGRRLQQFGVLPARGYLVMFRYVVGNFLNLIYLCETPSTVPATWKLHHGR